MQFRVILQSRTSSERLPGKSLLPLGGLPTAVLCALRAGNEGAEVVLATSTHPTDDRLAARARAAGIRVHRGPLDDVLARFAGAAADLPGTAAVVRLTADNPFVDGAFVQALVSSFKKGRHPYLGTWSPVDGLPYGLSAEVFTVAALRAASRGAKTKYDREHVTPWIVRRYGRRVVAKKTPDRSHLRCTMDDRSDYESLRQIFGKVKDPVGVSWKSLCDVMQKLPGVPKWRVPYRVRGGAVYPEMVVGTAQLGLDYGIANESGKPRGAQARAMIESAVSHGAAVFDTAREYGDAEEILGATFRARFPGRGTIVTKLAADGVVDKSVRASRAALGRVPDFLLLHRWSHHAGASWKRLLQMKKRGELKRLGASVYEPWEALAALKDPDISLIQIPFNILDGRWKGFVGALNKRPDVLVHARSALLQGVLASPPSVWDKTGVPGARQWQPKVAALARSLRREGPADLALAYVRAQPWLSGVVVGAESLEQLERNMRLFLKPALTLKECRRCEKIFRGVPERLLNPSRWDRR